ncbi:hypothetical protein, partial [Mycobacterium leprae]|uniref:hypothetical protein n=1 Tax=Mycobacterium leprae TaxID=1769 RepID=UPI001E51349A
DYRGVQAGRGSRVGGGDDEHVLQGPCDPMRTGAITVPAVSHEPSSSHSLASISSGPKNATTRTSTATCTAAC